MTIPLKFVSEASSRIAVSDLAATNLGTHLRSAGEEKIANDGDIWVLTVVSGTVNYFANGNIASATEGATLIAGTSAQFVQVPADAISIIAVGAPAVVAFEGAVSNIY